MTRNRITVSVLLVLTQYVNIASGNHPCVCLDSSDAPVYREKSSTSDVIGYMYEFDCTALLDPSSVNNWQTVFLAVQFHGETGYIENNPSDITIDMCPGPGPVLSTVAPASTEATTVVYTTTSRPTTKTTFMTTTTTMEESTTTTLSPKTMAPTDITTITSLPTITTTKPTSTKIPTTTTKMPTITTKMSTITTTMPTITTTMPTITTTMPTITTKTPTITTTMPSTTTKMTTKSTTTLPVPMTTTNFLFPSCPEGWLQYHVSCYQLHLNERVTHDTASSRCVKRNSHLLFINSAREQFIINGFLDNSQYLANIHDHDLIHKTAIWTGGVRQIHHSEWRWVDPLTSTTLPLDYIRWENSFPHHDSLHEDVCLGIVGSRQYLWHDFKCVDHMFYICERSSFSLPSIIG